MNVKTGQTGRKLGAPSSEASGASDVRTYQTGRVPGGGKTPLEKMDQLMEQLRLVGRREQGLATLRRGIVRFLTWCEDQNLEPSDIDRSGTKLWRTDLVASGLTQSSVKLLLWSASVYLDHLVAQGQRTHNPAKNLAAGRRSASLPRNLLKEDTWEAVLERLSQYAAEPDLRQAQLTYRAHVLAEVLYATGMRIAEAANMGSEDLDLARREVMIREGKGGRSRKAFLSDYAAGVLAGYLKVRPMIVHEGFGHTDRLFGCSEVNLSHFLSCQLKRVCTDLALPAVTAHGIRHMVGWHLLRAGAPLRSIQGILGHLQIRSTEIYTHVDKESLRAVLDSCHPRGESEAGDAVEHCLPAL